MSVLKRYLVAALVLLCNASFAQSFITKVSAKIIGRQDVLQIEYIAENASLEQFNLPNLTTWNVISGPNFSSTTLQTGKLVKEETTYSIMVQPKTSGKLTVPGATALLNNKPTRSNPVVVEVKTTDHVAGAQAAPPSTPPPSLFDQLQMGEEPPADGQILKKGENAKDKIKNNILIKLDVNKHSCYVGEPILAYYKLCTRLKSQSKVIKQPMFNGCTVVEMTGNDDPVAQRELVNGKQYNVYIIRKVQLFPLAEGKLKLPQTSVENKVTFYNTNHLNYRDLYYNSTPVPSEDETVTLENSPVTIDVKPLPPMPATGSAIFSGAVGKFDVEITTNDKAGQSSNTTELQFTIKGQGNIQQVKAPEIMWPQGLEGFDATEQDQEDKTNFPVLIRKTFSFPFVANKKGNYTIPPIQFTYFDANAEKYITKYTAPLTVHISQAKKINFKSLMKQGDGQEFQNRLFIILGAAFVAIIIGVVWHNERKHKITKQITNNTSAKEAAIAKQEPESTIDATQYLFEIKDLQPESDSSVFYKELCKNLSAYIETKFGIPTLQVNSYIQKRMNEDFTFDQLNMLLQNCNLGMYTPVFTIEEAMEHRLLAIEILNKLEKS